MQQGKEKLNYETLTLKEARAAGLTGNIFIDTAAHEDFIYNTAAKIYHDIHVANRDVTGFEDVLVYENIEKLISDLGDEIFDTFFDVEDEEFMPEAFTADDIDIINEFIHQPRPTEGNMVRYDLTKTDLTDEDLDDILKKLGFIAKEWRNYQNDVYPVVILYEEREGDDFHLEMRLENPFSLYLEKYY